jgi:uncharacterized tellurite resistance protein B-like protein
MKEKLSLMADLVKLAKCDGEYREDEQNFLFAIAQQIGITPDDYTKIFKENIEFTPPKLELDRIVQLQRLILVMSVDGETSDSELKMVRELGLKMGLNPVATNLVLSEIKNHPNNLLPPDRLIEIFKTYHN